VSLADGNALRRGVHEIDEVVRSRGRELANALLLAALHEPDEPGSAATVVNQILIEGSDDPELLASVLIRMANCAMMFFGAMNAIGRGEIPANLASDLASHSDRQILRLLLTDE
jgi:hypothetical protein